MKVSEFGEDYRSGWQYKWDLKYPESPSHLLDTQFEEKLRDDFVFQAFTQHFIRQRYYAGLFTSVTPNYFVIGKFYMPHNANIQVVDKGYFNDTLGTMVEAHGSINCDDMSPTFFANMKFCLNGNVMASRPKIDGDICRVTKDYIYLPGIMLRNDQNIPECEMEWDVECFHILHPYGLMSREFGKNNVLYMQDHKWYSSVVTSEEGVVLLTSEGEKRVKRYPTLEKLRYGEIWEVDLNGNLIRPRYGRKIQSDKQFVPLNLIQSSNNFTIKYNGDANNNSLVWNSNEHELIINSVYKDEIVMSVYNTKGPKTMVFESGRMIVRNVYNDELRECSAKLFLYDEKTGQPILFKDRGKQWDAIGGRIEPLETPFQTIDREVFEETGHHLTCAITLLGVMTNERYSVWVYIAPFQRLGVSGIFKERDKIESNDICPWYADFQGYVDQRKGVGEYATLWYGAVGMRHLTLPERKYIISFQDVHKDIKKEELFVIYEKVFNIKARMYYEYMLTVAFEYNGCYHISRIKQQPITDVLPNLYHEKLTLKMGKHVTNFFRHAENKLIRNKRYATLYYG